MKISLNWLKQFVEIPKEITPEKIAELLTLKTVEVEGIEKQGGNLENITVGKINKVEKHPNADKLSVCKVNIGEEELKQIVCGGINVREGMFVAVAKIGAKVKWHGEGGLIEIKKTKIRGTESEGMICASSEIGLMDLLPCGEKEIIDLGNYKKNENWDLKIGNPIAEVLELNDVIFEIDNKSLTNRPDLWGHMGIAREVAAILGVNFSFSQSLNFSLLESEKASESKEELLVAMQSPKLCKRYMAVAMSGIQIGESPDWMQKRLLSVGMRPINNIVDITNYVMLETGQPMHAFNQLRITNYELRIRNAKNGEIITTLDGVERELDESMLVIADSQKPIAIAGVMGGANSEVDNNTTEIILESANFEKVNNRKTSAKLNLRTEASMRYEKGLDPNLTEQALARCIELIKQIIPEAVISSKVIDIKNCDTETAKIKISTEYINKKIGMEISQEKIVRILKSLGFGICDCGHYLEITIPSWRATGDISIKEDIVEEVVRIYGYDNIKPQIPFLNIAPPKENKELKLIKRIKNILSDGLGMSETSNYSFISRKQLEDLGISLDGCIKLSNPLSADLEFLRPNLAINLLKNIKDNLRFFDKFRMFEIGSVFKDIEGGNCVDPECSSRLSWQEKFVGGVVVSGKNTIPFYEAKKIIEDLCNALNIDVEIVENREVQLWQHPYRKSKVKSQKLKAELGHIYELNPVIAKKMGIKNARAAVFELSIKALLELSKSEKKYQKISPFPAILRDIAIVAEKSVLAYNIIKEIKEAGGEILKNVELFDYYEGDKIGFGRKSLAFHLIFQSEDRTLEDGEADDALNKIIKKLKEIKVELRR